LLTAPRKQPATYEHRLERSFTKPSSARRALYSSLFVVAALGAPFSTKSLPSQEGSGQHVISSEVSLVILPVTVTDRPDHFVSGLDASNFQVYEDGRQQKISLFRHEDIPVTAGVVVDHSGSMAAKRDDVIAGAVAFVQGSNPQDREFVVNFSDSVTFGLPTSVPFTSRVADLKAALSKTPVRGETALYDALAAALERLKTAPLDKKVLLLISDGGDNASKHTFSQVQRMAQSASVIIYAIGLFDENSADQNPKVLEKLAKETGGKAYFPKSSSEAVSVCRQIAEDIRHQYTLGYSPEANLRPGYRKIRVKVNALGKGKLYVRTRPGYLFSSNGSNQTAVGQ
jgi:Ca-activated chloride channel homolog